jgi:hypothetical protein
VSSTIDIPWPAAAAMLSLCLGCSLWSPPTDATPLELPAPRMSPDSVAIQIAFAWLPAEGEASHEDLWLVMDEQHLAPEVRRNLLRNGLRSGLIGGQLPQPIRELLDEQGQEASVPPGVVCPDGMPPSRRIHCRSGIRHEIPTGQRRSELVLLHRRGTSVHGRSLQDAQCLLALRCFPRGDGGVRLELTPEIDHGPVRQKYVSGMGGFMLKAERDREVFTDLALQASLAPGQTLLLTCTSERKGIGRNFFVREEQGAEGQRLLLIRLAQSQQDDLFTPRTATPPLTTLDN